MERLEQEAEKTQGCLHECRKRRREIIEELRTLTKSEKPLEIKLPKLKLEISGCDTMREERSLLSLSLNYARSSKQATRTHRSELSWKITLENAGLT